MDSSQILVTGFPAETTKTQLMIYFQSERDSGGGDVENIEIDRRIAKLTFEDAEVAKRVLSRPNHCLRNSPLQVSLFPHRHDEPRISKDKRNTSPNTFENQNTVQHNRRTRADQDRSDASYSSYESASGTAQSGSSISEQCTVVVTGLPEGASEDLVINYFENSRRSKGGPVSAVVVTPELRKCLVTFESPEDAMKTVNHSPHVLSGASLQVSLYEEEEEEEKSPSIAEQCTVVVTGLPEGASEDLVINYFENTRRSKGGPVSAVVMTPELRKCLVTFESPEDATKTVNHSPHVLSGASLQVSLYEEEEEEEECPDDSDENREKEENYDEEDSITIIVSGILPATSEDAVVFYFENSKRSGGGEVSSVEYNDEGEAVITFLEVNDLQRLFEQPHKIDGQLLTVVRQPPKKKLPLDPVRIHVKGISETTTKDCLGFYLEKFADVDVHEVHFGSKNNALAIFESEPDFESLFCRVAKDKKGLEGKKPRLERVPVCSCILVTGLKKGTTDDTIELYFENEKRSGGKDVSKVERIGKDRAFIHFDDPISVQNVIAKSRGKAHILEGVKLEVTPYYPFLENTASKRMEMTFDSDLFEYIKMNHNTELQRLLEDHSVEAELSVDSQTSIVTISSAGNKNDSNLSWEERADSLKNFLHDFKKSDVSVASEIFDEIVQRWQKNGVAQETANFQVSFDAHRRQAVIVGKKAYVEQEKHKLENIIREVTEDSELMKSVVEVVETNFPRSRLTLLEMSGLCEKLGGEHRHLSITVDSNGQKLCFKGPRKHIQEVRLEVVTFISRVVERTTELPSNVIDVLKQHHVSVFIQDLLRQKSIQAVVLYDQGQSSNEVQVVGVDSKYAIEAEVVLQNSIQEKCIHLTPENTQVLESREWKDLQKSLTSSFKVGITVDRPTSNVWVSGTTKDAEECFHQVTEFLERNTILDTIIPVQEGCAKFISTVWKSKLDDIKRELSSCSTDLGVTPDCRGIKVSGTAEGLEKCLPRINDLVGAIQKQSILVDKPGMTKFFMAGKGHGILKAVEEKNKCVILTAENADNETVADAVEEEDDVADAGEIICSFSMKHGKRISVMKGDITKDRVDAIVNAANEELRHYGGLAAAIVRAGGQEIQDECNAHVAQSGRLLEGHVLVTNAGRLPCKQVIHAVGPKWDTQADKQKINGKETKQERYLKQAITNALQEAKTLKSIAIPAVSSGVFGFPRDLCAEVILDSIVQFYGKNPHCQLSEIHLINNDTQTVKAFEDEFRARFANELKFSDQKASNTLVGVGHRKVKKVSMAKKPRTPRSFITQGIHITVKSGDLSKEQADVLVGTAASNLNLSQNPCARALSQAAGPSLQQECTNIGHVPVGEIAVNNQPGNLHCKAVIFAICSEWENGKGKKVKLEICINEESERFYHVLKRLITKCLQAAVKRGMTSIAVPAIGTGTLQFPRAEVAEIYFDEVISYSRKNPGTTLKEVRFVLYDQDHPTVQAFEDELKKRNENNSPIGVGTSAQASPRKLSVKTTQASLAQKVAFTPVRDRHQDQFETNVGTLCFKVQRGDITEETTDAIVIISNKHLAMEGGVANVILRAGGDSIRKECFSLGLQKPGSVAVTGPGNLKAGSVFHIVPPDRRPNMESIKASVINCLREAEKRGMSSISFPAIGTGVFGLSPKTCAEAMLSAIREFQELQPASVQLIKMIIFQEEMLRDFRSAMEEVSGETATEKPGLLQRWASKFGDFLGLGGSVKDNATPKNPQNDYPKAIELVIFAKCKDEIEGAINDINKITKENSTKQVIENEAITVFSKEHLRRMHTLEQRYSVLVSVEKPVGRIIVQGQTTDILEVVGEIHTILHHIREEEHERKRAEALSKDIQWKYGVGKGMEDYESDINAIIEAAYHDQKTTVTVTSEEEDFRINLKAMTMTDKQGNSTPVERVDLRKGVELPSHWTPQPKDPQGIEQAVHLVPVTDAKEYQDVQNKFQLTCGNQIVKIERVQNPALFGTYIIRKQKMDEAKGSNEHLLFHGTPGDNCQLINKTGFNRNFHGRNATVYGKGVYFARDALYSARSNYSPADVNGYRYMYLTRVLVGEYTVGRQGLLTPPAKNPNDPTDIYDSVVDQIPNPGIFVVFYDWQCYPEYLITFS